MRAAAVRRRAQVLVSRIATVALHGRTSAKRNRSDRSDMSDMSGDRRIALRFDLRGHSGLVRVDLSANDDPVRLGHQLVARDFDESRFTGFPVVHATIEYAGSGLNASM